jgi:hypothetical protein
MRAMNDGLHSVFRKLSDIPAETLDDLIELISGNKIDINEWKEMTE